MKKLILSLFILCAVTVASFAQERTVSGTVTSSEDGSPIPGATVKVKEVPAAVIGTGSDGKFSFRVAQAGKTLVISYLGYNSIEVAIPASGNVGNVKLTVDAKSLNEVVVTAGGVSIQRREQGNQATTVKAKELTQGKGQNVAAALSGKVPGLQINAVGSGVNPAVRLVLRGNRSLLGNNQALVVVDNVIVPTNILGNLNPEDIEDIQVLNGAGAASLYGSDASNGALIITTKTGKNGVTTIKVGQTTTFETVSFLPKLQKEYGSGTSPDDVPTYTAYENQQYGPKFDGSIRDLGKPLADGSIQKATYSYNDKEGKEQFWDTGIANQTDFSLNAGDDKATYYLSSQYFDQKGTVPGDKYNRFTARLNGTREIGKVNMSFNVNYIQNRYDGGADGTAFQNVLMTPGQVPLTQFSDWKNNPLANDGFYNEYYENPYLTLGNGRSLTRNDYLTGNVQLKYYPVKELSLMFRTSINTQNTSTKSWSDKYQYSTYRKSITSAGAYTDKAGSVSDGASYSTQINPEFQAQFIKKLSSDFSLNVILGASLRDNIAKSVSASSSSMVTAGLYNVSNTTGNTSGGESNSRVRQMGVYADGRISYKGFLHLHASARNDWRSVLSKENRSLFYPSVDLSFIASDAISFLKESKTISSLKLRGGVSKVGQVNIGAYALSPTFGQQYGYPYAGIPGFGVGNRVVAPNINPEVTTSIEGGFDLEMIQSRVNLTATVYKSNTIDQTVPVNIPTTTGYTSFLTNTGEVQNTGFEGSLRIIPVRTAGGLEVSVGGNYTYNANKVLSISSDASFISIGSSTIARVGSAFPILRGTTYVKDDQGRTIVDRKTGFPTTTTDAKDLGITEPKHRVGLDLTASYKGFRFATVFEYRTGNVILSSVSTGYDFSGAGIRTTYFNRERFVVPNSSYLDPVTNSYVPNTSIQTYTGGVDFWTNGPSNTGVTSNYVYSAAFWKMREASIAYTVPKSVLGSLKYVKGAEISFQGRNLFQWAPNTNIYTDPEYSNAGSGSNAVGVTTLGQTPPGRYYGLSLSLTL